MKVHYQKKGTTKQFTPILEDELGAVDLTGATVVFTMRLEGSTDASTPKIDRQSCTLQTQSGTTLGGVIYAWTSSDVDTVGNYKGEFFVTFANGKTDVFPRSTYIPIKIVENLPS